MRIHRLHIENFGKLQDFDWELRDGLNRICADNGWGKSTFAAFVKAMFYGLDYTTKRSLRENERKRYAPWQGGVFGGSMEFTAGEKDYRVERTFGAKDKEDTFVLYDLGTGLVSDVYSERLGEELFGLDRAAFERSSYFAQQDFAASVNDSLNARLTHVEEDAGDMQNYEKASASLEERMKYYQKTGNRGQIGRLEEERRQVRERLAGYRNKELALGEWKSRLHEKELREKELLERVRKLDEQMQDARRYGELAAKKAQYDLLRRQTGEKEELLRQTKEALAEYVSVPLTEEQLDRCHENIYRVNTLRMQEEESADRTRECQKKLKKLDDERESTPRRNPVLGALVCLMLAAGLLLLVWRWFVPGALLLAAGAVLGALEMKKTRQVKEQISALEAEHDAAEQELRTLTENWSVYHKKRVDTEEQVIRMLGVPEGTAFTELSARWKWERQRSQEYAMLKQSYESRCKDAKRSQETYLAYREKLTEEELHDMAGLQRPDQDLRELEQELEMCRRQKDSLLREQRDMQNQIRMLEESAGQIPELEEEEERISEELEHAVHEHALLEKTLKYLKTARDQFSSRYLKELQQGLVHYLGILEPQYGSEPSVDVKLKVKVKEAGALRDLEYLSAGWQDMLQIAERFAIVDALYKEEQPVLILDDPFVNLDQKKRGRAEALLKKMAKDRQLIYFTCMPGEDTAADKAC